MNFLPRITSLLIGFISLSHISVAQQNYYWVGGTGNWSDVNHWATASGGSTKHTVAPTTLDNVYFDDQSFTGSGQIITIDEDANCHDFIWTGATGNPIINSSPWYLYISGSAVLISSANYNFGTVHFVSSNTGETVTTADNSFGSSSIVAFNGTGEWNFDGDIDVMAFQAYKGSIVTNGNNISAYVTSIATSPGATLDMDLGSSTIESVVFQNQSLGTLNLDPGTSEILIASGGTFSGDKNGLGPYTYYNLTFPSGGTVNNSNSINQITVAEGKELTIESGTTQSISSLDVDGNKFELTSIHSSSVGDNATFSSSSGTVAIDFTELKDVHAIGSATFNATNSIDLENTDGWNISAPSGADYYWIGNGGDWTDPTHWATTSGGPTTHGDFPGQFDDVYFDNLSFTMSGQTVSLVDDLTTTKNIDWTGVTNQPTFYAPYGKQLYIYGSANFSAGVTKNLNSVRLVGSETSLDYYHGEDGQIVNLSFYGSGEYTLYEDISCTFLSIYSGILNFDDITIEASNYINMESLDPLTMNFGASNIITEDLTILDFGSFSLNPETSVFNVSGDFSSDGFTFNHVILSGSGTITGANTFTTLEVMPGASIDFESGVTQTTDILSLSGLKTSPITLNSSIGGAPATISVSSGTVDGIYLILQDMIATGGATFNANQTIDNGNNTGWDITGIVGLDYYWVGGSGNWTDFENHWATVSGGSDFHAGVPGVLDNLYFDENSFSSSSDEVTIDIASVSMNDLDFSAIDESILLAGEKIINIYGSLSLSSLLALEADEFHFLSDEAETISAESDDLGTATFHIEGSGSWTLMEPLAIRDLKLYDGTFNTNGLDTEIIFSTALYGSDGLMLDLSTSTFSSTQFDYGTASDYTIDGAEATIVISSTFDPVNPGASTVTLNDLIVRQTTPGQSARVYGDLSFNTVTVEPGSSLTVESNKTISANQFVLVGTEEDSVEIKSTVAGEEGIFNQTSGTIEAEFLKIKDNLASGGADFYAFVSEDLGNVTGWTFSKFDQSIDFTPIDDQEFDVGPFTLEATASSGLDITFSVVSGPASNTDDLLMLDGTIGTVQVEASQAGNDFYNPASEVIEFEVTGLTQEITFEEIETLTYGDGPTLLDASSSRELTIEYSSSSPDVGDVEGNEFLIIGVGETTVTASQPGNDTVYAATSKEILVTVDKAPLSLTANNIEINYGDPIPDLTYEISGLVYGETEAIFTSGPVLDTDATIDSDAGEYIISVEGAEAVNYEISHINGVLSIVKAAQSISFNPPSEVDLADGPINLEATSNSMLEVALTYVSGPASLSGNLLTPTGSGEVVITATQSGNENYQAASSIQAAILVVDHSKADQTITFDEIEDKVYGDLFTLNASTSSELQPEFQIVEGPGEIVNDTELRVIGVGMISVRASQAGDDEFNPVSVTQSFQSVKAPLSIIADDITIVYGEPIPALTYEVSEFLNGETASVFTSEPSLDTEATGNSNAGTYAITVGGTEADNYEIDHTSGVLTIEKADQVITFEAPAELDISDGKVLLEPVSNSGLDITLTYISGPASLSGSLLTLTGLGEVIISASQVGNENYLPAQSVEVSILVKDENKTDQEISFGAIEDKTYGDLFSLNASSTSELQPIFQVVEGPAEIINNTQLSVTGVGSISVQASQPGNDEFNPAVNITQSFFAGKAGLTITADDLIKTYGDMNPVLTMNFDGFVLDDNQNSITIPTISTTALAESNAGSYPIMLSGGSSDLYVITLIDGTLTVTKAEATITITNLEQETDGSDKVPTIATDPTDLNVTVTYNGSADPPSESGEYAVVATIDEANYKGNAEATFVLVSAVLGLDGPSAEVKIYPNPSAHYISVEGFKEGILKLLDVNGRELMKSIIEERVDVSSIPNGHYLIILEDKQSEAIEHLRLIIKH